MSRHHEDSEREAHWPDYNVALQQADLHVLVCRFHFLFRWICSWSLFFLSSFSSLPRGPPRRPVYCMWLSLSPSLPFFPPSARKLCLPLSAALSFPPPFVNPFFSSRFPQFRPRTENRAAAGLNRPLSLPRTSSPLRELWDWPARS